MVASTDPHSEAPRSFSPRIQLLGPTAATLRHFTVSRAMATTAARWLRTACVSYFDDIGVVAKRECCVASLQASPELIQISGFGLKKE